MHHCAAGQRQRSTPSVQSRRSQPAQSRLPMPWGMAQRNKHLPRAALLRTHIVFDNRVSAIISAFIAQPFKYPLGCMALLARAGLIFCQPTIDLRNIRIKLGRLIGDVRRYPGGSEYASIFETLSRLIPKSRAYCVRSTHPENEPGEPSNTNPR